MKILFCRKNYNYPLSGICSYSPSKRMENSIKLLINFLIKEFPNIDIKLEGNSIFIKNAMSLIIILFSPMLNLSLYYSKCRIKCLSFHNNFLVIFSNNILEK